MTVKNPATITYHDITGTIWDWSIYSGINYNSLYHRKVVACWSDEKCIEHPIGPRHNIGVNGDSELREKELAGLRPIANMFKGCSHQVEAALRSGDFTAFMAATEYMVSK